MKMNQLKMKRIIKAVGIVSGVIIVLTSVLNGCLMVKLFRCIDSAQKALSKVDKAAELYIEEKQKV
jgi:hypothetical protein